jgi:uncharacterized protein (DUF302 family)
MSDKNKIAKENYKESMETSYCISKRFGSMTFQEAIDYSKKAFENNGFEVVMHFDLQNHIKKKLDEDIRRYTLLGMCNAALAIDALSVENKVGIMLPCNIIIPETGEEGVLEVAVTDPLAALEIADNGKLKSLGKRAKDQLQKALNEVEHQNNKL